MFDGWDQAAHWVRNEVAPGVACNDVVASYVLQKGRFFMGFRQFGATLFRSRRAGETTHIGFQWVRIHGTVLVILDHDRQEEIPVRHNQGLLVGREF